MADPWAGVFTGAPSATITGPSPAAPAKPDPWAGVFAPAAPVAAPAPQAAPATPSTHSEGFLQRVKSGVLAGAGDIMRGLRVPQQASVMALTDFVLKNHRLPNASEWLLTASKEVGQDRSFANVLQENGIAQGESAKIWGLVADVVADPLWFLTPAKVAKLAGLPKLLEAAKAVKPVAAVLQHPLAGRIGRALINPDIGKPQDYLRVEEAAQAANITRRGDITRFAADVARMSPEEQKYFKAYVEMGSGAADLQDLQAAVREAGKRGPIDTRNLIRTAAAQKRRGLQIVKLQKQLQAAVASRNTQKIAEIQDKIDAVNEKLTRFGNKYKRIKWQATTTQLKPQMILRSRQVGKMPWYRAKQRVLDLARKKGLDVTKIEEMGDQYAARDFTLGRQLLDAGKMDAKTLDAWFGRHLRREYLQFENAPAQVARLREAGQAILADKLEAWYKNMAGFRGSFRPMAERWGFLADRKDLPRSIRELMGEIQDPAKVIQHSHSQIVSELEKHKFLLWVQQHYASSVPKVGWTRLASADSFGPLKGLYVPDGIAEDITRIITPRKYGAWGRLVQEWKYFKIGLNPAAHARIILHNAFLADLAGVGMAYKPWRYMEAVQALAQGAGKGWLKEASRSGMFLHGTLAEQDLLATLEHNFYSTEGLEKTLSKQMERIYQVASGKQPVAHALEYEERLFKMAVYIDARKSGKSIQDAATYANQVLLNYRKMPSFFEALRRRGIDPFVAFPLQASQRIGRAVIENPAQLGKWGKVFKYVESGGAVPGFLPYTDVNAKQVANEKQVLPPEMDKGLGWVRLPVPDATGRYRYVNLAYILPVWIPFQSLKEASQLWTQAFGSEKAKEKARLDYGVSVPLSGAVNIPLLQGINALTSGIDPFTKKPLGYGRADINGFLDYLYKFAAPPFAPPIPGITGGGTATEQILRSAQKQPPTTLSKQPPKELKGTLERTLLAYNFRDINPTQERIQRMRTLQTEIKDIQVEIRSILGAPAYHGPNGLTPAGEAALTREMDRIRAVFEQLHNYSSLDIPEGGVPPHPDMSNSIPQSSDPWATVFNHQTTAPPVVDRGRNATYSSTELRQLTSFYSQKYGIPESLADRLIGWESHWSPTATSNAGAGGIAQIMPATAQALGIDPYDPVQGIEGGLRYLAQKYAEFHRWDYALAAYNAGSEAVRKYGGIPPFPETQNYVHGILGW